MRSLQDYKEYMLAALDELSRSIKTNEDLAKVVSNSANALSILILLRIYIPHHFKIPIIIYSWQNLDCFSLVSATKS